MLKYLRDKMKRFLQLTSKCFRERKDMMNGNKYTHHKEQGRVRTQSGKFLTTGEI